MAQFYRLTHRYAYVHQIEGCSHQDQQVATSEDPFSNDGNGPMHACLSQPGEPEQ